MLIKLGGLLRFLYRLPFLPLIPFLQPLRQHYALQSVYMISIQSSLQMLVPDQVRGRVMGFYGMTWSIMPLGGLQAGALAGIAFIGAPFAVAIGGVAVVAFALGPFLLSDKIRQVVRQLRPPSEEQQPR